MHKEPGAFLLAALRTPPDLRVLRLYFEERYRQTKDDKHAVVLGEIAYHSAMAEKERRDLATRAALLYLPSDLRSILRPLIGHLD